jgi:hypothetical protein
MLVSNVVPTKQMQRTELNSNKGCNEVDTRRRMGIIQSVGRAYVFIYLFIYLCTVIPRLFRLHVGGGRGPE